VSIWKPDAASIQRLAKSNPTVATRLERARAGDLWRRDEKGDRVPVSEQQALSEAMATATEQATRERTVVMERITAKGLTPTEAHSLWLRWWEEHCNGGVSPTIALRNDMADPSVRNHAAVWRARLSMQPA